MKFEMILLCASFDCMAALHSPLSSTLLDFIDSCLFSSGFALKVYVLYTGILSSYNKFFFYLSPKQKVF